MVAPPLSLVMLVPPLPMTGKDNVKVYWAGWGRSENKTENNVMMRYDARVLSGPEENYDVNKAAVRGIMNNKDKRVFTRVGFSAGD